MPAFPCLYVYDFPGRSGKELGNRSLFPIPTSPQKEAFPPHLLQATASKWLGQTGQGGQVRLSSKTKTVIQGGPFKLYHHHYAFPSSPDSDHCFPLNLAFLHTSHHGMLPTVFGRHASQATSDVPHSPALPNFCLTAWRLSFLKASGKEEEEACHPDRGMWRPGDRWVVDSLTDRAFPPSHTGEPCLCVCKTRHRGGWLAAVGKEGFQEL